MFQWFDRIRIYFGFFTDEEEEAATTQKERDRVKRWAPYLKG